MDGKIYSVSFLYGEKLEDLPMFEIQGEAAAVFELARHAIDSGFKSITFASSLTGRRYVIRIKKVLSVKMASHDR